MSIKIRPPVNSAFALYFKPKRLPALSPIAERINVTAPIESMAVIIFTLGSRAKVMPTASASILVATARTNIVFMENELSESGVLLLSRASCIMFPPINARSTNAIQWSKEVI